MTVSDFTKTLANKEIAIDIVDEDDTEIIKFYPGGTDSLSDELKPREIKRWKIVNVSNITVTVKNDTDEPGTP